MTDIKVYKIKSSEELLKLGDHHGNKFTIVI